MAAYRRVDDLTVTCRLTACTPGSAPGPTLDVEYGKPLPFLHTKLKVCELGWYVSISTNPARPVFGLGVPDFSLVGRYCDAA